MCHTVPWSVSFTWQCGIWYHDQCLSPSNVAYGTTTSVFHLAMCHRVPWPVPFTWQCVIGSTISATCQCVIRYHDQCLSPGNMSYGVQRPVHFIWQCVIRYHDQCLSPGNMSYGVQRPVHFTWKCIIRYLDQCISPGNVLYGTTTSAFHLAMCHVVPRPVQPGNMS